MEVDGTLKFFVQSHQCISFTQLQLPFAIGYVFLIWLGVHFLIAAILAVIRLVVFKGKTIYLDEVHGNRCPDKDNSASDYVPTIDYAKFQSSDLYMRPFILIFHSKTMEKQYSRSRGPLVQNTGRRYAIPLISAYIVTIVIAGEDLSHEIVYPVCAILALVCAMPLLILQFYPLNRYLVATLLIASMGLISIAAFTDVIIDKGVLGVGSVDIIIYLLCYICLFSGVVKFWIAALLGLIPILFEFILWGEKGDFCVAQCCNRQGNLIYVILALVGYLFALTYGYENERVHRVEFVNSLKLQALVGAIAVMDLESAARIIEDPKIGKCPVDCHVRNVIKMLEGYKAFLPTAIFKLAQPHRRPSEANLNYVWSIDSMGTHENSHSLRGKAIGVPCLVSTLEVRRCTILLVKIPFEMENEIYFGDSYHQMQGADQEFMELVEETAENFNGVIYDFGGGKSCIVFNGYVPCPDHEQAACECALELEKRTPTQHIKMSIVAADLLVGFSGTEKHKTQVVSGAGANIATRFLKINHCLGTTICVTESVQEKVQDTLAVHVVDRVVCEGEKDPLFVYELVGGPPIPAGNSELYHKAFTQLVALDYKRAMSKFGAFLDTEKSRDIEDPCKIQSDAMIRQTMRLVHVCYASLSEQETYYRKDGWRVVEADDVASDFVLAHGISLQKFWNVSLENFALSYQDQSAVIEDDKPPPSRSGSKKGRFANHAMIIEEQILQEQQDNHADTDTHMSESGLVGENIIFDTENKAWHLSPKVLGVGGFGKVLLGMSHGGLFVAVKVMENIERPKEVLNEIRLLSQFRHLNIVAYIGCSYMNETLHVIMEYVAVGSLASVIRDFGHLSLGSSRKYMKDILKGLEYLHTQGIIHRDLKPHNVLLDSDGRCKLADFGTALLNPSTGLAKCKSVVQHQEMTIVGTPLYMSPETLQGVVGPEADVWAFGILAIQCFCGMDSRPAEYSELTNEVQIMFNLATMAESPTIPDGLPLNAKNLVKKCIRVIAEERPKVKKLLMHPFFMTQSTTVEISRHNGMLTKSWASGTQTSTQSQSRTQSTTAQVSFSISPSEATAAADALATKRANPPEGTTLQASAATDATSVPKAANAAPSNPPTEANSAMSGRIQFGKQLQPEYTTTTSYAMLRPQSSARKRSISQDVLSSHRPSTPANGVEVVNFSSLATLQEHRRMSQTEMSSESFAAPDSKSLKAD